MFLDRLTALRLLSYFWLTVIMPPNALTLNVVYNEEPSSSSSFQSSAFYHGGSSSGSGGRKFGGYRIVPRACKDATADAANKNDAASDGSGGGGNGSGVCMFNYECAQIGGSVVGSCVDVFLFGACCRLPAGTKLPYAVDQQQPTTVSTATTLGRQPSASSTPASSSFLHPVADTILLHRNGTVVQNAYRPDDMSAELQMANRRTSSPSAWHHGRWPTSSPQPPAADWHQNRWPASPPTSKVDYADPSSPIKQTQSSSSSSSSSPVSKSTDSVPNVRKTTPSATHHSTTTAKHDGYADDYYDGMVLVPTLTVHDPNSKTPVENNSIHHILSILNQTPPTNTGGSDENDDGDGDDPLDTSPSYQHAQHSSSSTPHSGLLYTWGSIDGDTKTPGYGGGPSSATFPATRPASAYYPQTQHYDRPGGGGGGYYGASTPATTTTTTATSTHHLPGPHFHVTTGKPAAAVIEPIAPTVIVLSAANDNKNPNKYSTTTAVYTSSSYRPPPSHVKPSQSIIVTGKPSVSAAYTTTATYHHHQHHQTAQQQQQQQQQNFVPVSSTTLADHYYNTNNYNVLHHTSSKPSSSVTNYGHRPSPAAATTTTTSLPPTLSSTVHHDGGGGGGGGGNNNNVFTTVITSVNHQYHKYQQPTTATSTVARPVLNNGGSAAVVGGYRPHQTTVVTTDVDYPSPPAVTPSPQVYITATDVHHQLHHAQQQQPPPPPYDDDGGGGGDGDDEVTVVTAFNSTDTFAFPPVRDPNVNLTAAAQQEKPIVAVTAVEAGGVGGDYDSDADPNPQLQADDNLDDKVHLFVEKVVQSLQGNFEDLERVLLSGDQSSGNITVGMADEQPSPNKRPATTTTTTTRKPPRPGGTSKPPAASKPTKPPKATTTSTYRPTPITLPLDAAPYLELTTTAPRPTKVPALLTPVQLFQPTTYTSKPPTKQPVRVTPSTTVVLDQLNVDHEHTTAEPDYRKVCGVRPLVRKNGRIVGGTGSTFGEWPWQVLVREATWLGLFTKNKCGGVLITQKHVITAAHCQPGFLANLVAVFGEYDISGEVESKRSVSKNVKRVIVHRQYDAATFENDIALLELESPVGYDQHIVPICMPDDDDDFTGRMASVTGWGRLKYGGGVPSILQEVQVPIIENQVCQDMFETAGHSKTILSSFLCAGYANGQRDSCEGDSGGPLMIEKDNGRWTLIGTVSHGIKCAAPYLPGVYMRTTYYKPWLQTITGVQ